ncbi:MAG: T9SS type A sorting domain-containing protein [Bacteroidetes bacterium]|nr:T9SS type A sorting domain-containing protein [Bacteroidota bacterium]
MKTKLLSTLTAIFFCAVVNLKAQTPFYSFSQYTSTYADLTAPVSLNNSNVWNYSGSTPDPYIALDIATLLPYFQVYGDMNNAMRVVGGAVQFYNNGSQQLYYINGFGLFFPGGMKDKGTTTSLSPISYQVTGSAPNRILKVQWKNAGNSLASADYINVQIWLYETSNIIEAHYGSTSITNAGTTQLSVGVGHTYVPNSNMIEDDFLENSPSNPVLSMNANAFYGIPANGTVYKFMVGGAGVNELNNPLSAITVFPNPTSGKFIVDRKNMKERINDVKISISDVNGQVVLESALMGKTQDEINVSNFSAGTYFIRITSDKGTLTKKIIVNR